MALTASEKNEIEVIVRKEIKNFMGNNTIKQFEDKLMDRIQKDIKRGKLEGDIKDITLCLPQRRTKVTTKIFLERQ